MYAACIYKHSSNQTILLASCLFNYELAGPFGALT